jgi:cold shock CspA family protein
MVGHDHGFLETFDGRDVYFHKNSLVGDWFETLVPGTEVAFVEEPGEMGPQATTVWIVGRHAHM